jgi:hypothetical protein
MEDWTYRHYITIVKNQHMLATQNLGHFQQLKCNIFIFCLQVSTTKGTGGDVIILEEAAYCDPGFFYETVAPLMLIGRTSLLAISTLTSEINFYSRLIKMKDPLTQVNTQGSCAIFLIRLKL